MNRETCGVCGGAVAGEFCTDCGAFQPWVDDPSPSSSPGAVRSPADLPGPSPDPTVSGSARRDGPGAEQTRPVPPEVSLVETTVMLRDGEPASVAVSVGNRSRVVEAFLVEVLDPPDWLEVTPARISLLPGAAGVASAVLDARHAPAGTHPLTVRVRPSLDPDSDVELAVRVVVPRVAGQLVVRASPALFRLEDEVEGWGVVVVENRGANIDRHVRLSARDEEGVLRVEFLPGELVVPARAKVDARVRVVSPSPPPGRQVTRPFVVLAGDGEVDVEQPCRVEHTGTPVAPIAVRLDPQVLRAGDAAAADFRVALDNSRGTRDRLLTVTAREDEGTVRFTVSPDRVRLARGETAEAAVHLILPPVAPGVTATRTVTVSVSDTWGDVEGRGTLIQTGTATAPDGPVQVELEPRSIRLAGEPTGRLRVRLDNRSGTYRRVLLTGRDAADAVTFRFDRVWVDLAPGETAVVSGTVSVTLPPPGQETVHEFTVAAVEGSRDFVGAGTITAGTPADPPILLRLDPERIRVQDAAVGRTRVLLDNRGGLRDREIRLSGRDPDGAVEFTFPGGRVRVPAGRIAAAVVQLGAAPPPPGQESVRAITVVGTDGAVDATATGTFVQATRAAAHPPVTEPARPPTVPAPTPHPAAAVWRVLLVVLGALVMVAGTSGPWRASRSAFELAWPSSLRSLSGEPFWATPGLDVVVLAAVALLGLVGPRGVVIRWMAAAALAVLGAAVYLWEGLPETDQWGWLAVGAGAVITFVGGALSRPGGRPAAR